METLKKGCHPDEGYSLFTLCGLDRRFRLAAVRHLRSASLGSMSRLIKPQAFKRQTAPAAASTTKFALIWLSLSHTHTSTSTATHTHARSLFIGYVHACSAPRGALLLRCVPSRQRQSNFVLIMCLTKHLAAHRVMAKRLERGGEVVGSDGCANCKLSAGSRCLVGIMRRWAREMREERRKWEQRTVKKTQRIHTHTHTDTLKYTSNLHSLLAMRVRAGTLDSAGQDNNSFGFHILLER